MIRTGAAEKISAESEVSANPGMISRKHEQSLQLSRLQMMFREQRLKRDK